MKILWNLLCQYNNIYKKKIQTTKNIATVATVFPETVATVQEVL